MNKSIEVTQLLAKHPIISDQVSREELEIILSCLGEVLRQGVAGEVVEFGCYTGTTSLFLQRMLRQNDSDKRLHVYDSFAGLPDKVQQDASVAGDQFKTGELSAKKSQFILNFKKANLPLPYIHKAWFKDLTKSDVPDSIALAFLDGDYYESILDSLNLVWDKLSPGSILIVDDYHNEALPGAKKALDEWLSRYAPQKQMQATHSLAVVKI